MLLALLGGCEQHEPNWLYRGQWIDIDGQGRDGSETCAGTFKYLDAYAGAVSKEFGANRHLGSYRWYPRDTYDAVAPCGDDLLYPYACVLDGVVHTAFMPQEHEVVHLADGLAGKCPNALAEGLAVYYAPDGLTPAASDINLLGPRLENPSVRIPNGEYNILGKFAAFLVREYGIDSVVEVCSLTGRYPSGAELAFAMESVLGASPAELIDQLSEEPSACDSFDRYRSRVFACGVGEAAPDAGRVGETSITATFTLGCASEMTSGPYAVSDTIWINQRLDLEADALYLVAMYGEDGLQIPEVEFTLAKCEPCGAVRTIVGEFIGPENFDAGRYSLELRAPADFSGSVIVKVEKL